ncbi:MAG: ATP phosphoribosyltransferase [Ruminococcus sp.]|jgi:ATP phosphoribosyltransferase regulatory subunit|nr:ATP phosphoribosyltransferase [Ruminococcus sp.]
MKNYDLITPEGTRDLIFDECERLRETERKLRDLFENAGYREITTPGLEFFDVFNSKSRGFQGEDLYKTTDDKGRVLVLRPDSTLPIARIAATRLKNAARPLKIFYTQKVFRNNPGKRRRNDEIRQMGVELIGEESGAADRSIVSLAIEVLGFAAKNGRRVLLEIGDIGIVSALLKKLETDEDSKETVRSLIESKNIPELVNKLRKIGTKTAEDLMLVPQMFGSIEELKKRYHHINDAETRDRIAAFLDFCGGVFDKSAGIDIHIETGFAGKITYYSGLVLRGYIEDCGEAVLSGGRYDNLLREFGGDGTATGFMVNVDLFGAAIRNTPEKSEIRPVRIALTKGRLEKQVTALLENKGFDVTELRDKGRKLILTAKSQSGTAYEFILAKSPDVITYVDSGVCDLGVVGYDMIAEHGGKFYEIFDLGIGVCKFALAGLRGMKEIFFKDYKNKTIATKYPAVARAFFEDKGLDIDIVKIEGSVELAPLVGLSDAIVDIVETGKTLEENGLEVYEDIVGVSARIIANRTSYKMRTNELSAFTASLNSQEIN